MEKRDRTRRYNRTLQQHVDIAEQHATYLVERLAKLASKAKKEQAKRGILKTEPVSEKEDAIYREMLSIVKELGCVEQWVKERYPTITDLWNAILAEGKGAAHGEPTSN